MLETLQQLDKPISVAITGMGAMGKGLLYQTTVTPGFVCAAVSGRNLQKAVEAAALLDVPHRVVQSEGDLQDAVAAGLLAVTDDSMMLAGMDGVDCLIESTNAISDGLRYSVAAMESGKHLCLMNAEIDLAFGKYMLDVARKNDVTYVSCDGDQHAVIRRLIDDLRLWGFDLIMGGNIKGFLNRYADPVMIKPEADKRNLSYDMCTAYTDGTKLNIEMALLANALDMQTDVVGMHGPRAEHVNESLGLFELERMRQLDKPVVDYVLQAQPGGGVYAIGYCDHEYQKAMMKYYKMGDGPFYCFYRPYHLCHVEAMEAVADAVLNRRSLLEPAYGFVTNVFAYAKKALNPGETVDGIGGHASYGLIENCGPGGMHEGLPSCLAHDVVMKNAVAKDQPIKLSDVEIPTDRLDFATYAKCVDGELY